MRLSRLRREAGAIQTSGEGLRDLLHVVRGDDLRSRRGVQHSFSDEMLPPLGQKLVVGDLGTILLALEHGSDDPRPSWTRSTTTPSAWSRRSIWARLELAASRRRPA